MSEHLPKHIAIIMDGNGRWAQQRDLLRVEGHRAGVHAVKAIVRCCIESQIPVLSVFAFSSENWSRPENEVGFLMQLFMDALVGEVQELHQHGVCLRFMGDKTGLSTALREQMTSSEKLTSGNPRLILNVAINYGGKWDIVQAVKTIAKQVVLGQLKVDDIDESLIASALCTHDLPQPDLFIRTGGEQRISNFFLWQLAYTELYFTDVQWPDFSDEEFHKALLSFSQRERRFGAIPCSTC